MDNPMTTGDDVMREILAKELRKSGYWRGGPIKLERLWNDDLTSAVLAAMARAAWDAVKYLAQAIRALSKKD